MGIPEPTEEIEEQYRRIKEMLINGEITAQEAKKRLEELLNEPIIEKH